MQVLEVLFDRGGDEWTVKLQPEGATSSAATPWRVDDPSDPEALFWSIFDYDSHRSLYDGGPLRLRVRPSRLAPTPGKIPDASWSELLHPTREQHVYDREWTLAEVTRPPVDVTWNGHVVVHGSPELVKMLRRAGVADVSAHDTVQPPAKSLFVVCGPVTDVTALQSQTARCALVVWCDEAPASRGKAIEVVRVGAPCARDATAQWLTKLFTALRDGNDPECAVRLAAIATVEGSYGDWWLRGVAHSWTVEIDLEAEKKHPHWRRAIDRTLQESALEKQVAKLCNRDVDRRLLVAFVPGDEGSGLEWFRLRDLAKDARAEHAVDELLLDVPWKSDSPGETFDELLRAHRVEDVDALSDRLASRAKPGRTLLLHVRHRVVAWAPHDEYTHLDAGGLHYYLARLCELSDRLKKRAVRVFVFIPCIGEAPPLQQGFGANSPWFPLRLGKIGRHVDRNDLKTWIITEELDIDGEDLERFLNAVDGLPYDDLIARLEARYAGKLR